MQFLFGWCKERNKTVRCNLVRHFRVSTIVILSAMFGLTVYQCGDRVANFLSRPLNIDVSEEEMKQATFPAIVVCPGGQFRPSTPNDLFSDNYALIPQDYYYIQQHKEQVAQMLLQNSAIFRMKSREELADELDALIRPVFYDQQNVSVVNQSLNRIAQIGLILKPYFPHIAQLLKVLSDIVVIVEPYDGRNFPLDKNSSEDWNIYRYRNLTMQYDACAKGDWYTIEILWCRIVSSFDYNTPDVVTDLRNFNNDKIDYRKFTDLARPSLQDTIVHCDWMGEQCDLAELWTPQGLCFSIGPKNNASVIVTETGSKYSVRLLIDALTYDFPRDEPMIYYHPSSAIAAAMEGSRVNVKVGMTSSIAISEIRYSDLIETACGTRPLRCFDAYSKKKCIWERASEQLTNTCRCISPDSSNMHYGIGSVSIDNTTKSCIIDQELTCVANVDVSNSGADCPDDCNQSTIDVDLATSSLNLRLIRPLLPTNWKQQMAMNLKLAVSAKRHEQLPGEEELDDLVDQFFHFHLSMIRLFWWKNGTDPYYPAWMNWNFADYFEDQTKPNVPCNFTGLNVASLDISMDRAMIIQNAINETLGKYNLLKSKWTDNFMEEAYYPFLDNITLLNGEPQATTNNWTAELKMQTLTLIKNDLAALKNCVTESGYNKFSMECSGIPDRVNFCFCMEVSPASSGPGTPWFKETAQYWNTNISYANYWELKSITSLLRMDLYWFDQIVSSPPQSETTQMRAKIDAVFSKFDKQGNSLWDTPIMIYKQWLVSELGQSMDDRLPLLSSEMATRGGEFDVFSASQGYSTGMSSREEMRKALVAVSTALSPLLDNLLPIRSAFGGDFYKGGRFQELLFGDSLAPEKLNLAYNCVDELWKGVRSLLVRQRPGLLSPLQIQRIVHKMHTHFFTFNDHPVVDVPASATESIWFSNFVDLIDNELYIYTEGRGYEEANLAQVSIFFRSFRTRNAEQKLAYNAWALLSDIGGALGLWLGATVVTLYELAMHCCTSSKTHRKRYGNVEGIEKGKRINDATATSELGNEKAMAACSVPDSVHSSKEEETHQTQHSIA